MKKFAMFQWNYTIKLEMTDDLGVSGLLVLRVFRPPEHKLLYMSRNSIILTQIHFTLILLRQTLVCES